MMCQIITKFFGYARLHVPYVLNDRVTVMLYVTDCDPCTSMHTHATGTIPL